MKNQFFTTLLLFFIFLLPKSSVAYHLIGGDISYECLGNDRYRFTIKIYRDCSNPQGADFDSQAAVAIYIGNSAPYQLFSNRMISLRQPIRELEPPYNPCLILPPYVCVEQGEYIFETTLPDTSLSYHIVYQRCCRNSTINNIIRPDQTGSTYTIELTAAAQRHCNNSPVFKNFPPIVICAGEPLDFDHSATDAENDQIVYEFCSPLKGGGFNGQGRGCNSTNPNPACPPPFQAVDWVIPNFHWTRPLAGDPVVKIDPNTGRITGTPEILGQYVVGICASEYRNGELLSVTRRDFQFNVANCEPTIEARMDADVIENNDNFIFNSCGENKIQFKNTSFQQSFINQFRWEFLINGQKETFSNWSPEITFPGVGAYPGFLMLNPGQPCGDSAQILVNIFPEVNADFSFDYDTCKAEPVIFNDLSNVQGSQINKWQWLFGDGDTSVVSSPEHRYRLPGTYVTSLKVIDVNNCSDERFQTVSYFPVPALIIISPSDFVGCPPAKIFFNNLSRPIDESYKIDWDFGDSKTSKDISPTHVYEQPGIFDVHLNIVSPVGCQTDTTFKSLIEIQPEPVAGFTFSPEKLSRFQSEVQFYDASYDVEKWEWLFPGNVYTQVKNPVFIFPDTGIQEVKLIVTHPEGCKDTLVKYLDLVPEITFFLPNAFTPNNDSKNEFYKPVGILDGIRDYKMSVWNRWGGLVFESFEPENGWNGRHNNEGEPAPSGTYRILVSFKDPRGQARQYLGTATLIR